MSGVRMSPVGRDVVIEGRSEAKSVRLLSFPLRFRKPLFDAFLELAGVPVGSELPPETVFHLESETGVVALQASFLRGLSGPEVIVKILPDLRTGISLDSVGFNPGQLDITEKVLRKGNGLFLVSSPGPEGVATTLFAMLRQGYRPGLRAITVEERHRFRNEGYIQLDRRQASVRFTGDWSRLAESLEPDILMIEHLPDPRGPRRPASPRADRDPCPVRHPEVQLRPGAPHAADARRGPVHPGARHAARPAPAAGEASLLHRCRPVPARPSLRMVGEQYRDELERNLVAEHTSFFLRFRMPKCGGRATPAGSRSST